MQKGLLALAIAVFVTGCGQNGNGIEIKQNNQGGTLDVPGAIAQMEAEGSAPMLDRGDSMKGEDANDNGIRDDIEGFIESTPVSEEQKVGLSAYAKGMQKIQTSEEMTPEVALSITDSYIPGYFCMTTFTENNEELRRISEEISAFTANTPDRAERYLAYNASMDGASINLPSPAQCQEMSQ